ncbi:winged helix-turn-helix domain-containing protein [Kordiimonas aestuarii]|uniref:winged helix-turn-helix domain-containing protein n=1 Tax=Kordiimonas aestuarii TaxID=1005925 RepID=UPI0021CE4B08|nr:winged helix-turn-helix domain-containing protein [Kordiimonas aestuarii]
MGRKLIGEVVFDPNGNRLLVGRETRPLEPRLVRLLEELCAVGGEPVTREALLEAVSSLPYAGDEALTQAISKLRQV